jgi:phosphoribosylformylglycinamidine synthase
MDFKKAGNLVYIIGMTKNELGGSEYFRTRGYLGNSVPEVDPVYSKDIMDKLSGAIAGGMVRSCHDCSEGGIAVALAEMAFAGGLGADIDLEAVPLGDDIKRDDYILFSESNSRFLAEVPPEKQKDFEKAMTGTDCAAIGRVTAGDKLRINGLDGSRIISAALPELKEAWQKPLRW